MDTEEASSKSTARQTFIEEVKWHLRWFRVHLIVAALALIGTVLFSLWSAYA